jgi:molybdopterin-guanine dinucleotide biosynthesis adapter protein
VTRTRVAVLGFAAFSGTGKTTLLARLLPVLTGRGLRIGMIKHAHHSFDIDQPGKDSYVLRKAGAGQMLIASEKRWALMVEHEVPAEPRLSELIARLDQSRLDLILVEGFKRESFPKIELHRPALGHPLLFPNDPGIIAVALDAALNPEPAVPVLDINSPQQIAGFILENVLGELPANQGEGGGHAGRI